MKKNKYKIFIYTFIVITLFSLIILSNKFFDTWTYVKYNDTLYVLNTDFTASEVDIKNPQLVGTVEKKLPSLITPSKNNTSNGVKERTEIYTCNDDENYILVKHNGEYYSFINTITYKNEWKNGMMGKLK